LLEDDFLLDDDLSERGRLLLLDLLLVSPRLLLFDRLEDDLCLEDERFELLRLARLALIFLCIMARLLRRLVKRIPRNMKRLPMRQRVPSAYLALFATLKLAMLRPAEEMELSLPDEAEAMRSVSWQWGLSRFEHVVLEAMRAPAAE